MKNTTRLFVLNEWDDEFAYTAQDLSLILGCNSRLARYYLMEMVREGHLSQLKYRGKTYYIKSYQSDGFRIFKYIGLRIL